MKSLYGILQINKERVLDSDFRNNVFYSFLGNFPDSFLRVTKTTPLGPLIS